MPICIPFSYIKGQKKIEENSTPSWKVGSERQIKLVLLCNGLMTLQCLSYGGDKD